MNREDKIKFVADIKERIKNKSSLLVVHYQGLTVGQMSELRGEMYKSGIKLEVVKNRLMKIAIEGSEFESLKERFSGPIAIVYSEDPILAAKVLSKFAKTNDKLKILAGMVDKEVVDLSRIEYLATIPSLDELRAKIIGLISAPASKIARVLSAYSTKNN